MSITSNPRITSQLAAANIVDAYDDRRDLIVGQLGTDANATTLALNTNVQTLGTDELINLFGEGELLQRIRQWMSGNGGYSPLDVIGVSPATSPTAATCTVVVTGTSTASGTLYITPVDESLFKLAITVSVGDTASEIGDAIVAKLATLSDYHPPFTAVNASGTVTFTAADGGTIGNYYGIKASGSVAGLSYTVTEWTGGATDPTYTSILDAAENIRYTGINWPESWIGDVDIMTDFLDDRFNMDNAIMDGSGFTGSADTYSNLLSLVSSMNTKSVCIFGCPKSSTSPVIGPVIMSPPGWVSAYFQGVRARRLTEDAPIADFVVADGANDSIGGAHTASLPYFNTPLDNLEVVSPELLFTQAEQEDLEEAGITLYGVNKALDGVIMGPTVTTQTTDSAGNANVSFLYLNYVDTGSICREVFYNVMKSTFAQSRLTEGDLKKGYTMNNEKSIRATLMQIYRTLADKALLQAGDDAEKYFSTNTTVKIELSKGKVTITNPLPIVTQLRIIIQTSTLSFDIDSTGATITF